MNKKGFRKRRSIRHEGFEMRRNIGDEIIKGLQSAIEYAKGDKSKCDKVTIVWVPGDRTTEMPGSFPAEKKGKY